MARQTTAGPHRASKGLLSGQAWRMGAQIVLIVALGTLSAACERKEQLAEVFPQALASASVCANDGMLLMQHRGPKGQIRLDDGEVRLYCDTKEFFEALYDADLSHRIAKSWVQPFDDRAWAAHSDGWAEPGGLVYVFGSRLQGSMGPTIVPFSKAEAAHGFIAQYDGRMLAASELSADVVAHYRREIREGMRATDMLTHGAPQQGLPQPGPTGSTPMSRQMKNQ